MAEAMTNIKITIHDNSPEVLRAIEIAITRALWSMGATAEGYAKLPPPVGAPVDTGRLRNSITHKETDRQTIIGTNVEYAVYQELGTSRGVKAKHFLKNAVANHTDEYKKILKESLKNV